MSVDKEILYLLSAWERGADADDYANEIEALRQAIEQAEKSFAPILLIENQGTPEERFTQLYTAPQQREWVGLTDDDMETLFLNEDGVRFAKYIEAKLKEKNT